MIQAHWTHQILVTCIFPTLCNHFHTHLVVYRAITSKCWVSPILNKYYSILCRTAIVLSCVPCIKQITRSIFKSVASCTIKCLLRFPPRVPISSVKPATETHSFFNVSEHKLKIIYMYLLYPKEYCDIN